MTIEDHNKASAVTWGEGGRAYDDISFNVSDALLHGVERLWPAAGDAVLDVATGTGWTARNAARFGANVTAIDIAKDLLAAAKALSKGIEPPIDFQLADAEALPFKDGAFDKVISTFGVMFAPDQQKAADEMARVCRSGGRLVLVTWPKGGYVESFFATLAPFNPAPPPAVSPLEWGHAGHVQDLLKADFEFVFETGNTIAYFPDSETAWKKYVTGFGPVRSLANSKSSSELAKLKSAFIEFHDQYQTEAGLTVPRDYLVAIGTRR